MMRILSMAYALYPKAGRCGSSERDRHRNGRHGFAMDAKRRKNRTEPRRTTEGHVDTSIGSAGGQSKAGARMRAKMSAKYRHALDVLTISVLLRGSVRSPTFLLASF